MSAMPPIATKNGEADACFIVRDKNGQALAYVLPGAFLAVPGLNGLAQPKPPLLTA